MADVQNGRIAVWDLPVRLIHWSFVALIPALWLSAESGRLDVHETLGLIMFGLVVFRILWGLVGSSTARFSGFVRGPAGIRAYLASHRKGTGEPVVGHNPLGGWSVLALLGLLAAQVTLGLFAQDTDAVASGPLNHLVGWDAARAASEAHEAVFNLLVAFIVLHVGAIAWYKLIRKDDLVRPMLTGRKAYDRAVTAPRMAPLWLALIVAIAAGAMAVWVSWGAPPWGARFPWDAPPAAAQIDAESYM